MKSLAFLSLLLAFAPGPSGQQSPKTFAVTDVTLIDGTGSSPQPHRTVVISGNRIAAIQPAEAQLDGSVERIDGKGKFLIPGLWDMHVHLAYMGDVACPALIANGVTSVRDLGGGLEIIDWMRAEIAAMDLIGPRVYRSGPVVDGPKPGARDRLVIDSAEDGRRAVSFLKERDVDFIKVHNGLQPEPYFALLDEAKRQGIQVVGHIPLSIMDPAVAIDAGHGSVEHVVSLMEGPVSQKVKAGKSQEVAIAELTDAEARRLARKMVANAAWFDPTLVGYWARADQWDIRAQGDPRDKYVSASGKEFWDTFPDLPDKPDLRALLARGFDRFLEITRIQHQEGVRFLAGTDLAAKYVCPGFSLHDELVWLNKAGLNSMEALMAATRNCAESLGKLNELGTIEQGKLADLVLLDANPLEDIRNTTRIAVVVANGRVFRRAELDKILEQVASAAPTR